MAGAKTRYDLTERAQHVLAALVKQYIHGGQPVGSKALARATGLELSPATIRSVMADLEERGFIRSPHTSAGRIPTVQGYRFFVDSLVSIRSLERWEEMEELKRQLGHGHDTQKLVASVSEFLSEITHLAGIATLPRLEYMELRQVEFLPLSEGRVLAILVTNEHEVQNRVLQLPHPYTVGELQRVANYLNAEFGGKEISQVRRDLLHGMERDREHMNEIMRNAVEMAQRLFTEGDDEGGYVLVGQTHLMEFEELSDVDKLRQLFEAFNQKREILHLLDQSLSAQGVQIFIGEESGYEVLGECSVVTSTYSVEDRVVGVLGVIGPTRMAYDRVIPMVDITAKLLGAALNSRH